MEEPNQIALILNTKLGLSQDEVYALLEGALPELLKVLQENKFPFPEDARDDDDLLWIDDSYADWIEPDDIEDDAGDFE